MTTKEAVDHLVAALKSDPDYYRTWEANITMAFVDEWNRIPGLKNLIHFKEVHQIANRGATNFLDLLCRTEAQS